VFLLKNEESHGFVCPVRFFLAPGPYSWRQRNAPTGRFAGLSGEKAVVEVQVVCIGTRNGRRPTEPGVADVTQSTETPIAKSVAIARGRVSEKSPAKHPVGAVRVPSNTPGPALSWALQELNKKRSPEHIRKTSKTCTLFDVCLLVTSWNCSFSEEKEPKRLSRMLAHPNSISVQCLPAVGRGSGARFSAS
jgi:hypothetical protein